MVEGWNSPRRQWITRLAFAFFAFFASKVNRFTLPTQPDFATIRPKAARMRCTSNVVVPVIIWAVFAALAVPVHSQTSAVAESDPFPVPAGTPTADDLHRQTTEDVMRKSWGCVNCHQGVTDMHDLETVKLGCIDCHGGNADATAKEAAHVQPCLPQGWPSS